MSVIFTLFRLIHHTYGQTTSNRYDVVHQYINKYCAESLVTIQFVGKPPFRIEYFDKPFVNVQNVDISDCDLGEQFKQIFTWFPHQSHLNIHADVLNQPFFIDAPTPGLKHVTIKFNTRICVEMLKRFKSILNRLRVNHQLRSLTIKAKSIKMTMNFLLDAPVSKKRKL